MASASGLHRSVDGVPAQFQPAAHALVQARDEVTELADALPPEHLGDRPGGTVSARFHLQHRRVSWTGCGPTPAARRSPEA